MSQNRNTLFTHNKLNICRVILNPINHFHFLKKQKTEYVPFYGKKIPKKDQLLNVSLHYRKKKQCPKNYVKPQVIYFTSREMNYL